jgi:hypothetical protein
MSASAGSFVASAESPLDAALGRRCEAGLDAVRRRIGARTALRHLASQAEEVPVRQSFRDSDGREGVMKLSYLIAREALLDAGEKPVVDVLLDAPEALPA